MPKLHPFEHKLGLVDRFQNQFFIGTGFIHEPV